jgi:hypothetical protein
LEKALAECRARHAKPKTEKLKKKRPSKVNFAATILEELKNLATEFTEMNVEDDGKVDK